MFCATCGSKFVDDSKFCTQCGTQRGVNAKPTPSVQQAVPMGEPVRKQGLPFLQKKWLLAGGMGLCVALAGTGGVVWAHPLLRLQRSVSNVERELMARLDTSPAHGLGILLSNLNDGQMDIDFTYSMGQGLFSLSLLGDVSLQSHAANGEFALAGEVSTFGVPVDLEVHVNRNRVAARSRLLDDQFYGITFASFERDINSVANMFGMSAQDVTGAVQTVSLLESLLNQEPVSIEVVLAPYLTFVTQTLQNAQRSTQSENIDIQGEEVTVNRLQFSFDQEAFQTILDDLQALIAEDSHIQSLVNGMYMMERGYTPDDERAMEIFLEGVAHEFARLNQIHAHEAETTLSFYTGSGNRLIRMALALPSWEGSHDILQLDLGRDTLDTWSVSYFNTQDSQFQSVLLWEIEQTANGYRNRITEQSLTPWSDPWESHILTTDWHTANGNLRVDIGPEWHPTMINASFLTQDRGRGFNLGLYGLPVAGGLLNMDIDSSRGARIQSISYTNIDQWSIRLIQDVQRLAFELFMNGMF